jgi:predicted phage terminase large subunit-like protein
VNAAPLWGPTLIEAEALRHNFRQFVKDGWKRVDPAPLVWGWHHDALCDHLSYVSSGDIRFLLVNMPPRTSKSLITSVFWPVWEWINHPHLQFLTASYALQLPWFQERWGYKFAFSFDEKLKRQYSNDKGGRRIALATDSATTGEGGDRIIVDDPHNAKEAESDAVRLGTCDWWDYAVSSRLNDPDKSSWVVNGQRTHALDLFGHIRRTHDTREIVSLVLPNEFDMKRRCITVLPGTKKIVFRDPRKKAGELLCEKRISADGTARLKRVMRSAYTLQYQQDPKSGAGHILAREKWQLWEGPPPEVDYLFTVWDTAYGEKQENDYSARTDWGVFKHRRIATMADGRRVVSPARTCMILLGAWRGRVPYSELKSRVIRHYRKLKPTWTLVENKASGISLCQELSRAGVRGLRKVKLDHGGRSKLDKVERANIASVVLDDEVVYYVKRDWAEVVIDECAAFPKGAHDDYVDTCLNAWQWVRRLGEIKLWEDEDPITGSVRLYKRSKRHYG